MSGRRAGQFVEDLFGFLGGQQQQGANDAANAANEQRYNDINRGYGDIGQAIGDQQAGYMNFVGGNYARTMDDIYRTGDERTQAFRDQQRENMGYFDQNANYINQGYRDRYNQGMAYIDDMGTQERKDINQQYQSAGNAAQANLLSRGMGASTLQSGAAESNLAERGNAMGRLNDRLLGTRLNAHSGLSGDALSARTNLMNARMGYNTSYGNAVIGSQDRTNQQALAYDQGVMGNIGSSMQYYDAQRNSNANNQLGFMAGRNDIAAQGNGYLDTASRMAQNRAAEEQARAQRDAASQSATNSYINLAGTVLSPFTFGLSGLAAGAYTSQNAPSLTPQNAPGGNQYDPMQGQYV